MTFSKNKSSHFERKYARLTEEDSKRISSLDPINMDHAIHIITELNKNKDIQGLVNTLKPHIPSLESAERFDYFESIACMRDLGIFLGSIKRHGAEPAELVPELNALLELLGKKTYLPPRDTLFHYTIWNPSDNRMRTYTDYPDERCLIESVQISMFPLLDGIDALMELTQCPIDEPLYSEICEKAENNLGGMINGIVHAKRKVSTEVFANVLRFYFDPIMVNGKQYFGPGAVEMPLFVFDHLLWSSDINDEEYVKFKTTYLPFNVPAVRKIYFDHDNQPSLVSKAIKLTSEQKELNHDTINALKALLSLCNRLKSFRMPHKKLAEESYAHQKERDRGSGGYSTDILSHILSLNLGSIKDLESALNIYMDRNQQHGLCSRY